MTKNFAILARESYFQDAKRMDEDRSTCFWEECLATLKSRFWRNFAMPIASPFTLFWTFFKCFDGSSSQDKKSTRINHKMALPLKEESRWKGKWNMFVDEYILSRLFFPVPLEENYKNWITFSLPNIEELINMSLT